MSNQLQTNLETILNEKTTKILPENIKKDVQIFNVVGTLEDTDMSTEDRFITLPARSITNGKISVNPDMFVTVRYNTSSGGLDNLGFKRFVFIKTSTLDLPLFVDSSNNIDYVALWIHSDGSVQPYSSTPNGGSSDRTAIFKKFNAMPGIANSLEDKNNLSAITSITDETFDFSTLNLADTNGWICTGLRLIEDYNPSATERLYTSPDVIPSQATENTGVRNIFGKEQKGEIKDYGNSSNYQVNMPGDIGTISYTYKPFNHDVIAFNHKYNKNAGIIRPGLTLNLYVDFNTIAEAIGLTADKIKAGETILGITGTYEPNYTELGTISPTEYDTAVNTSNDILGNAAK